MKIADKVSLTAVAALLGLGLSVSSAQAQSNETQAGDVGSENVASEEVATLDSPAEVPDSVKNVVEQLNSATKDITLEDLNSAREAVVKLDVLIDIEKRLNDLMSLRKEREETSDDLSDAIPQSAFDSPPEVQASMPVAIPEPSAPNGPLMGSGVEVEVMRVTGASGRYMALIKDSEGLEKQVRVGDKLDDGSKVKEISRYGVTLKTGSKIRTVEIKDVGTIFTGK